MIPLFKVFMTKEAVLSSSKVLESGYIGQGEKVEEFEKLLKDRLCSDYIVTTNSGTSAEHLAYHLLKLLGGIGSLPKIEDGDEVLTSSLTCTATNWPILANNLNIKWVDIDPITLNVDLDDLSRKITKKTKIITVVHWGGYPVDLDKLRSIQDKAESLYGFRPIVIEDCAHSFGSYYNNKPIGSHGNICTFSFQAIKHLTSVDGGALVMPNIEAFFKARLLRWYGIDRDTNRKDFRCEADIKDWGFKFHMNDVNAVIGIENLKVVDCLVVKKHKENALFYDNNLKDIPGVTLLERSKKCDSSFWIYSVLVENRQGFMDKMKEKEIMVSQVHKRNDEHTCVSKYRSILPNLDLIEPKIISIPVGWWVTEEQRQYVVDSIKGGW